MSAATRANPVLRVIVLIAVILVPLAFAGLFVSSLAASEDPLKSIPAAIVNEDELVNNETPDGSTTPVFAGRALVTELTKPSGAGFDWKITNAKDAKAALAAGEVYAILTVPSNFSKSILSVSGDSPEKAQISIETDDSHSYLAGSVAQVVGEGMVSTFGDDITSQYLEGLYGSFGTLGKSLQTAAEGAGKLADGAGDLSSGLSKLGDGASSAADGAHDLSTGVSSYTAGVDSLSSGLGTLSNSTSQLPQLSTGVSKYTTEVSKAAAALAQVNSALQANPNDQQALYTLNLLSQGLGAAASAGTELRNGAAGLPKLSAGVSEIAGGAQKLSGGSSSLRTGTSELASGLDSLATGTKASAKGSSKLEGGAQKIADGLEEGASQVPSLDEKASADMADVAAEPVTLDVSTDHPVTDAGRGIATFFVPLGLWIGALAIFLVLRPLDAFALGSTASTGRLALSRLARASALALGQAVVLVALLHGALGVDWMLLPATLLLAAVMALAFTAFHFLLTLAFGRAGLVVSLLALAVQAASAGSPFPTEILAGPFRAISPFLPLSHGVSGMQAIVSGGMGSEFGLAVAVLAAFGLGSAFIAMAALSRLRRAASLQSSLVG